MTKRRAPLSIDAALARIAGQLPKAYLEMADVAGRAERTVRNWGDPDTREQIPMDCAIALDLAFQQAGGDGAPIFECYAALLEIAGVHRFADRIALGRRAADAIRECGQAGAALVDASQPSAGAAEQQTALQEVEQAIAALKRAIPHLPQPP